MAMYSSYTDLNNTIKENIAVGHKADDRITNQLVRFFNNQNEYWGTFEGVVNSKSAYIAGGVIQNVKLSGCTLLDETGAKLNLTYVADDILDLQKDIVDV